MVGSGTSPPRFVRAHSLDPARRPPLPLRVALQRPVRGADADDRHRLAHGPRRAQRARQDDALAARARGALAEPQRREGPGAHAALPLRGPRAARALPGDQGRLPARLPRPPLPRPVPRPRALDQQERRAARRRRLLRVARARGARRGERAPARGQPEARDPRAGGLRAPPARLVGAQGEGEDRRVRQGPHRQARCARDEARPGHRAPAGREGRREEGPARERREGAQGPAEGREEPRARARGRGRVGRLRRARRRPRRLLPPRARPAPGHRRPERLRQVHAAQGHRWRAAAPGRQRTPARAPGRGPRPPGAALVHGAPA